MKKLAVSCPVCGSPPGIRATDAQIEAVRDHDPGTVLHSVQCHRCASRDRITFFDLTVRAYLEAA